MTLDEIEKFAIESIESARIFGDSLVPTHHSRLAYLARAVLAMLPVVRSACRLEDTRRAVIGGKDTHRELLGRGEDFENAIDAMRGALEGK